MPRLKWSPQSMRDVARLHDFLAPKSRDAAKRAVKAIRQGLKLLGSILKWAAPSTSCPRVSRMGDRVRQRAYVALYRYDGKEVVILAVRHGREAGY